MILYSLKPQLQVPFDASGNIGALVFVFDVDTRVV